MDLDAAADELYGGSPDDFVERRKALVAEARKARDRELVAQLGKLRRPTRTAWLVNRLAREAADQVTALLDLGDALADAQRRGSGPDLRRLSAERRTLVDRLARQAVRLGADHGYDAPDSALQEVSQTLQAALGDDATREQLRAGRLTTAISYGGFGGGDLLAAMAASMPTSEPEPDPEPEPSPEEPDPEPEPDPREAERAAAEQAWEDAQQAEAEAERDAEAATARADALADRIEELRQELADAEAEEVTAREEARAARRRLQEVRRLATEAQQARDALDGEA